MTETWTIKRILDWTIQHFTSNQIPEPRLGAELLLADVLNCKRIELYLQFERILTADERGRYRQHVMRRLQREPVQLILSTSEFMAHPFKVSPAVLIPRQDTETLVECALLHLRRQSKPGLRILDIGTGSGCIAVTLAKEFPGADVWAIDISKEAVEVAEHNARQLETQVHFLIGDIFDRPAELRRQYDLVVCNPPYISDRDWPDLEPEVRSYEPEIALRGGADGLDFYRKLTPLLPELTGHEGCTFLEIGYDQAAEVCKLLHGQNYQTKIYKDYRQKERVVAAGVNILPGANNGCK